MTAYDDAVLADDPVAYWPLGETTGTVAEDLVGSNDGTYSNTTLKAAQYRDHEFAAGWPGIQAEKVTVAHHASIGSLTGDLTIEAWVRVTDTAQHRHLIAKNNSNLPAPFDVYLVSGLWPRLLRGDGGASNAFVDCDNPMLVNTLTHVVITQEGTTVKFYLQGAQSGASKTLSTTIADLGNDLWIGRRQDNALAFVGQIGRVAVYDYALSAARVLAHYDAMAQAVSAYSTVVLADAPLGYWRLNETAGVLLNDSGPARRNATAAINVASPPAIVQTGGQSGATDIVDGDTAVAMIQGQYATVDVPAGLHVAAPISVEAWARRRAGEALQISAIVTEDFSEGSNIRYILGVHDPTANRIFWGFYNSGWKRVVDVIDLPDDGEYHHLVGTYDGVTLKLYRDGALAVSQAEATALPSATGAIYFGRRWDSTDQVKMDVDEIAIYNVALTDAQVLEHYEAATTLPTSGSKGRGGGGGATGNRGGHSKPPKPPGQDKPKPTPPGQSPPPTPPSQESQDALDREPPQRRYLGSSARTPIRSLP